MLSIFPQPSRSFRLASHRDFLLLERELQQTSTTLSASKADVVRAASVSATGSSVVLAVS